MNIPIKLPEVFDLYLKIPFFMIKFSLCREAYECRLYYYYEMRIKLFKMEFSHYIGKDLRS